MLEQNLYNAGISPVVSLGIASSNFSFLSINASLFSFLNHSFGFCRYEAFHRLHPEPGLKEAFIPSRAFEETRPEETTGRVSSSRGPLVSVATLVPQLGISAIAPLEVDNEVVILVALPPSF